MGKKIVVTTLYLISIFCIVYYAAKYYCERNLKFEKNQILGWTIVMVIIVSSLIIGMFNSIKLNSIKKQNDELLAEVSHLSKKIGKYHYSEMSNINSTMECVLDLDKGDD
jgi:outer membrane murein-binding lipoprotein Lpp